jgi:iron complex outermembrane recepter protein
MIRIKQIATLIALIVASTVVAFGQKTIKGTVTDAASKEPLVGAAIAIKGTSKGTLADINGAYSLDIPANATTIVVSFVGYGAKEISVGAETTIDVQLSSGGTLDNVVVLGSRAPGRTNTQSAVPVDVITPKDLKGFSQVDVGQILNYVAPSFNSNRQTVADGTDHVDPASLRGLGPDQVLVLVNGKRRHTSALININGTVGRGSVGTDMNVIPVAAIERIEVLRDGAAAQYGSDAIAGVINVVLKKDFDGLAFSMTSGANNTNMKYTAPNINGTTDSYNKAIVDGEVLQFDLMKGFRLGKEGRLMVAAQYNERAKTNRSGLDNAPTTYIGSSGGFPGTPAGLNQDSFRRAVIANDAAISKTNGYNRQNMVFGNSNSKNIGVFVNGAVPLNADGEIYFAGGLTYRTGEGYGNNRIPVSRNQQPLNADGTLANPNGFLPGIRSAIGDQSFMVGVKQNLGEWKMDLSHVYGANQFAFEVFNSGNSSLPNTSPQQTVFDAGRLKFSQNTTNFDIARTFDKTGIVEGLSTAFGAELRTDNYQIVAGEQNSYYGNGRTLPAAPLLSITGAANGTTVAAPGSQVFPGYQPSNQVNARRTGLGFYADIEGEFAKRLLLGVAGRYEDFSDFGNNFSGKVAGRLKIIDQISLRGSFSTGFRAPSLQQRYFNNTSTQFVSGLPSNTLTVNNDAQIARTVIGVDALRPETSVNAALGITAKLSSALSLTVDAYQIDIKDRIVYSGAFSRALLGFAATDYLGVNNVNFFANAANTRTKGVDIVANSKLAVGKGFLNITAAINFNKNEVTGINSTALINDPAKNDPAKSPDTRFQNLLFDRQQISRIEVWQPKNKINLSLNYSIDKFNVTLRVVRFGEAKYVHNLDTKAQKADGTYWNAIYSRDAAGAAFIDQTFKPVFITDLIFGYSFTKELSLSIGANNIFDVYPDQIYIDPRNAIGSIDYVSGRDASNRGRLLFQPNQGGYNGRFLFGRLAFTLK